MIIWISGAYGVGKSTLAEELENRMENAMIFDAEAVGNAVRDNYPNKPYGLIFEDYPLWCDFCYRLIKDICHTCGKDILIPMTLVRQSSYVDILERLRADGIVVKFIILEAAYRTVHDRILARGEEEDCWCIKNIEMARACTKAVAGGIHITTDNRSVSEIADAVLEYLSS